jgi:hypothetical protein
MRRTRAAEIDLATSAADGKVDDPTAAPNFPTLAQRFNKRLGGARRHSMVRLKAQPKFLRFRQFRLEHQRYAIGNSGALKSGGRIDRSGLVAKGTPQAHHFSRHPAEMIICRTVFIWRYYTCIAWRFKEWC